MQFSLYLTITSFPIIKKFRVNKILWLLRKTSCTGLIDPSGGAIKSHCGSIERCLLAKKVREKRATTRLKNGRTVRKKLISRVRGGHVFNENFIFSFSHLCLHDRNAVFTSKQNYFLSAYLKTFFQNFQLLKIYAFCN